MKPHAHQIPVVVVVYNTPDLIRNLLTTFRQFYPNPVNVLDGSDPEPSAQIKGVCNSFAHVNLVQFGYNIHHGPGMAWAIQNLGLQGPVLFLDSDIEIVKAGFIEDLQNRLQSHHYGVGAIGYINRQGFDVAWAPDGSSIPYLHPPCMLCNPDVMRQWPLPIKHGAPMTEAMLALHDAGLSGVGKQSIIGHVDWVLNDLAEGNPRIYIDHLGRGTVFRTGGYHLDAWSRKMQNDQKALQQAATSHPNTAILPWVPKKARKVVDMGVGLGFVAPYLRAEMPACQWVGLDASWAAVTYAKTQYPHVFEQLIQVNVDTVEADFFQRFAQSDVWVLNGILDHCNQPAKLLEHIGAVLSTCPSGGLNPGQAVIQVGNAQHWRAQMRLAQGGVQLDDARFTRTALLNLLRETGWVVTGGAAIQDASAMQSPEWPMFEQWIQSLASFQGEGAAQTLLQDALATHFVVVAEPA